MSSSRARLCSSHVFHPINLPKESRAESKGFLLSHRKMGSDGVFPELPMFPEVSFFSPVSSLNGYSVFLPEKVESH